MTSNCNLITCRKESNRCYVFLNIYIVYNLIFYRIPNSYYLIKTARNENKFLALDIKIVFTLGLNDTEDTIAEWVNLFKGASIETSHKMIS